jgi:hypothetical protein
MDVMPITANRQGEITSGKNLTLSGLFVAHRATRPVI